MSTGTPSDAESGAAMNTDASVTYASNPTTGRPILGMPGVAGARGFVGLTADDDDDDSDHGESNAKRQRSTLEQIRFDEEMRKKDRLDRERRLREKEEKMAAAALPPPPVGDRWIQENIIVKIIHPTLADGKYHKLKAVITEVAGFQATVKLLDSKARLRLDQEYLETVLPALGGSVRILAGKHKGAIAKLEKVDQDKYCAQVVLTNGEKVDGLLYEQICKVDC